MHSALYTGRLSHRRFTPVTHAFDYRVTLAWLDLAELDQVFRGRWLWSARRPALAWFRRTDYLGDPAVPLDVAVRDRVERETGVRPAGPVRLLTQLRTFGFCFNPVSFYYCFDARDRRVEAIVAEITNTPWNERHAYVLRAADGAAPDAPLRFRLAKAFHVSPFMPMDLDYDWRFPTPGERLVVRMENRRAGHKLFDASLVLRRREITAGSLAATLARQPLASLTVLGRIYWQALRLWHKRAPFHVHPARRIPEKAA
ncbi:MAG TPA: DUF1365 domain-containing protein [Steroidobacteraceae bacterium]|nr:DUF1365 domain-containing protein [Steroidobacteraceae bacterium]